MNKQIKVLYILHSTTIQGGANKSFLTMVDGLSDKGIIPLVVVPDDGPLCHILAAKGIGHIIIKCHLAIYPSAYGAPVTLKDVLMFVPRIFRRVIANWKSNKSVEQVVLKFKPDIIHTNLGPLHNGHAVAKKLDIPHVWHIREYQDLDFKMRPLFSMRGFIKKLHFKNNHPIAISAGVFNHFQLGTNARIISNGIARTDSVQFVDVKQPYFLFVGRLESNKGIREVIEAFCEFAKVNKGLALIIAGDTENLTFKKEIVTLAAGDSAGDRIKFLGARDDINELMANATALIVSSVSEAFGRITVEAMFNGCLVIGKNCAGTKEIIEKERLGILYSGKAELISAMVAVENNGIESYFGLIRKAQERAVALYSQEQSANAVADFYSEILNN